MSIFIFCGIIVIYLKNIYSPKTKKKHYEMRQLTLDRIFSLFKQIV